MNTCNNYRYSNRMLLRRLASYKVCIFVYIIVQELILDGMVVNFCGNQIFMGFIRFLIHKVSYAWCLKYIWSAWFLDI